MATRDMDTPLPPAEGPVSTAAAAGGAKPRPKWRWLIHLLLLAAYPVLIGVLGAGHRATAAPALTHSPKGLFIVFVVQFAVFGAVFGLAWLASRATLAELLCRWRGGVWIIPASLGYSVLLRLGLGLIAMALGIVLISTGMVRAEEVQRFAAVNRPDVGAVVDIHALRQNPLYFWLTVTLVSFVLAGFREELWRSAVLAGMRALWPARFASLPGQIAAAAIAAVVFGLGHLAQGPIASFGAGLLGFGLGTIMVLHRSIWPAVIAHGAFDATTFGLLPWAMEKLQNLQ